MVQFARLRVIDHPQVLDFPCYLAYKMYYLLQSDGRHIDFFNECREHEKKVERLFDLPRYTCNGLSIIYGDDEKIAAKIRQPEFRSLLTEPATTAELDINFNEGTSTLVLYQGNSGNRREVWRDKVRIYFQGPNMYAYFRRPRVT